MGEILYGNAIHIREQAKIDAARITQKSGNERRAAESQLQRFSANLANQRIMDAAGKQIGATNENIARNLDAASAGTLMGRVQAAEELGSSVAMAAAAGVGGSSVEMYNNTLRLTHAMQEEQQGRAVNSDNIAASNSKGDILTNAIASQDSSVYRADLDFTQYVDHHKMGLLTKIGALGAAAAATYFGGPQAGAAVIGLAESSQKAQNGDFAGANSALMGAVQNGFSAYKDTRSMGGSYWGRKSSQPGPSAQPTWGQPGHEGWASTDQIYNSIRIK